RSSSIAALSIITPRAASAWLMVPRSLEPSDNNIVSLRRFVAFVELTRESRSRVFAGTKFDCASFAASGLFARGYVTRGSISPEYAAPGKAEPSRSAPPNHRRAGVSPVSVPGANLKRENAHVAAAMRGGAGALEQWPRDAG